MPGSARGRAPQRPPTSAPASSIGSPAHGGCRPASSRPAAPARWAAPTTKHCAAPTRSAPTCSGSASTDVARALLIANPAAARTDPLAIGTIMSTFQGAGWRAEVLATGGPGDARRLAEYGVRDGVDVVAVFGGDGTTMQAAAALVGTDVVLG